MKKKNLLFVFADQWRRSAVGIYNDDPVYTPNIDDFASQAVVCTNAISSCPLCSPARASLLSGLYPLSTGVFTNCKTGAHVKLSPSTLCISDVLKANGYETGYIGKWHLDEPESNNCDNPSSGATYWDAYTPPGKRRHGFDFWYAYNAYDSHLHPHYWHDDERMIQVDKWSVEHETDIALEFMKNRHKDRPFALYISWNPPHSPYDKAPHEYWEPYENLEYVRPNVDTDKLAFTMHHTFEPHPLDEKSLNKLYRDYFASVTGIDSQFGRLVRYLKDEDLLEDTIVVLTADHGDMLASHSLIAKHVWYEESIGIPFIIGSGGLANGVCHEVFGSLDVPCTLLSLLSIPQPHSWEGKDISEAISGLEDNGDSYAFTETCPGREVFIKEFEKNGKNLLEYGWRAVRDKEYTYVVSAGYKIEKNLEFFLYDNIHDPYQMNPKKGDDARKSCQGKRLEYLLLKWMEKQKDPFICNLEKGAADD